MEWLGEVPTHWRVQRLKYLASINDEALPETTDPEYEFDYVDIGGVQPASGITGVERQIFETSPSRARRIVRLGDTIVSTVRTYLRAIAPIEAAHENLVVSTGFAVVRPRRLEAKFLSYSLRESGFIDTIVARSVGVSYPAINALEIGTIPVAVPPSEEQVVIAKYLDKKTLEIHTLVAKKSNLIDKLKEKRSALISRTVTRGLPPKAAKAAGLNPHPKFKKSGIEWIGDVPEHWEILTLQRLASMIQTGPFGSQLHESDYVEGGTPLINPAHISTGILLPDEDSAVDDVTAARLSRHRMNPGDIVMGRRGEIGRCAVIRQAQQGWFCGTGSLVIRLGCGEPDYFARIIGSIGFARVLEISAVGTTMLNLNPSIIGRMRVPVPPASEQHAISAFLDHETSKIEALIAKVEQAIERLQEYRAALITAAVTGKIDVRQEAARIGAQYSEPASTKKVQVGAGR